MISDLSPGDRLSLKGKLFELQKKLNLIDIEQRLDEQYSFQPRILTYELPDRKKNFIENATKADLIRKVSKIPTNLALSLILSIFNSKRKQCLNNHWRCKVKSHVHSLPKYTRPINIMLISIIDL